MSERLRAVVAQMGRMPVELVNGAMTPGVEVTTEMATKRPCILFFLWWLITSLIDVRHAS